MMAGGSFEYFQNRYEWDDIIDRLTQEIAENNGEYTDETISEFQSALDTVRKARVMIRRIDYLLSGNIGEETFHRRLAEDLASGYNQDF